LGSADEREHGADGQRGTGGGRVGWNAEHTRVDRFNFLCRFIAFHHEQLVTDLDGVAILFEPLDERSLFHGPAESRKHNWNCHNESSMSGRIPWIAAAA
jgi:hypothetical protein